MNVVRLAAAGSGKTWGICHDALEIARKSDGNRVLMVTYTNRGLDSIRIELKKQNYGVIPSGVVILSWY